MEDHPGLSAVDAVVLDMDGVLWRGSQVLPGAARLLSMLSERSTPFLLATNNASRPPESYVDRVAKMGVTIGRHDILTSAQATAEYLSRDWRPGARVFVFGGPGLVAELSRARFDVVTGPEPQADLVVAGIDFDVSYEKLANAALHLQHGATFIATNADPTYPAERGLLPGAGSLIAALVFATGKHPLIIGKPESAMYEIALSRLGAAAPRTLMVGDRLDTDILGAKRAGWQTALVTTGVDGVEAVERTGIVPDAVVSDLEQLTEELEMRLGDSTRLRDR